MEKSFKLLEFNFSNESNSKDTEDGEDIDDMKSGSYEKRHNRDDKEFMVQMYGINEKGKTCSLIVHGFKPFFYVKVGEHWTMKTKCTLVSKLKQDMGDYWENSLTTSKLIRRKKLYGFDGEKEHKFIFLEFANQAALNKAKSLWYEAISTQKISTEGARSISREKTYFRWI